MGDQIRLANVIRVERDEERCVWVARIGPRGYGLEARAALPENALFRLANKAAAQDWWWDNGWVDRLE